MSDNEFEQKLRQEYRYWQQIERHKLRLRNQMAAEILPALLAVNVVLWWVVIGGY